MRGLRMRGKEGRQRRGDIGVVQHAVDNVAGTMHNVQHTPDRYEGLSDRGLSERCGGGEC